MKYEKDEQKDLSKAFTGPQIRTIFGSFGRESTGSGSELDRVKAMDRLKSIASRKFSILEERFDEAGVYLKVAQDPADLESRFEYIRIKFKELGFVPRFVKQKRDLYIVTYPLPRKKRGKGIRVNIIMLILTIITTVWAGSILWITRAGNIDNLSDMMSLTVDPINLMMGGVTFAFPLLLILGTHELGHYITARRYRIDSSLPYFIPVPPLISPIGTFGALISMKEPLSTRKSLVDIGAAGPIAGFIVAIPVTVIGLILTDQYPAAAELIEGNSYIMINPPLLFSGLQRIIGVGDDGTLYPTAFAGWIGLFVTALNLLPAGQLDGGHIARGALGDKAKYISMGTVAILVIMGLTTGFTTYILFAVLILFLGSRHPPPLNDISPLGKRQIATAVISIGIMALTFHPVPLEVVQIESHGLTIEDGTDNYFVSPDTPNMETIEIWNDGMDLDKVSIHVSIGGEERLMSATNISLDVNSSGYSEILNQSPSLFTDGDHYIMLLGPRQFDMDKGERLGLNFILGCSSRIQYGNVTEAEIILRTADNDHTVRKQLKMVRARNFMETEVDADGDRALVRVDIWMLDGRTGDSTISLKFLKGADAFRISMMTTAGNWSNTADNFTAFLSLRYDLGNISWIHSGGNAAAASFRFTVEPMDDELRNTGLQISTRGPGEMMDDIEVFL